MYFPFCADCSYNSALSSAQALYSLKLEAFLYKYGDWRILLLCCNIHNYTISFILITCLLIRHLSPHLSRRKLVQDQEEKGTPSLSLSLSK